MTKKLLLKHQDKFLPEYDQDIPSNGIITVGSEILSTIVLSGALIAPEQFVIVCENNQMMLLCRVEGTSVNGVALAQGALHNLQYKDVIAVGDYTFLIEDAERTAEILTANSINEKSEETEAAKPEQSSLPFAAKTQTGKTRKGLKNILEDLRAEEKFFFGIEIADGEESRVYIENEQLWLVWTNECVPVFEAAETARARAQIRKDWSGVVLHPLQAKSIWINNTPLTEPKRLKDGDRLSLLGKEGAKPCPATKVRFHEPTALLVLDSILPKELPLPISLDKQKKNEANGNNKDGANAESSISGKTSSSVSARSKKNLILGYFTFTELIIMTIGTLVTAVVIFLILEFF